MNLNDSSVNTTKLEETEIMSSNMEKDTFNIAESTEMFDNTQPKHSQLSDSLNKSVSLNDETESGKTIIQEDDKIFENDTSPTVNYVESYDLFTSRDIKSVLEDTDLNEDTNLPLYNAANLPDISIKSSQNAINNSTVNQNEGNEKESGQMPLNIIEEKDSQIKALLKEGVQTFVENSSEDDKQMSNHEGSIPENMPSTSGNSQRCNATENEQATTSKRSIDKKYNFTHTFVMDSDDNSEDDSGKRQRMMSETEIDSRRESALRFREYEGSSDDNFVYLSDNSSTTFESSSEPEFMSDDTSESSVESYIGYMFQDIDNDEFRFLSEMNHESDNDDDDEYNKILQKNPPTSRWSVIQELNNRQLGSNDKFTENYNKSLYTVEHLKLWHKLEGHTGCVNTVEFNEDGSLIASASDDQNLILWDWAAKKKVHSLRTGHTKNVFQAKWMPLNGGDTMVTSSRDGQVRLINLSTSRTHKLAKHKDSCNKLATHIETPHVVLSVGKDGRVLSIDLREEVPNKLLTVKYNFTNANMNLYSIHLNPLDSNEFCLAGDSSEVLIYDKRKVQVPIQRMCPNHLLSNRNVSITSAIYNYNGTEVLASYSDEHIYLFDKVPSAEIGTYAHYYKGHRNAFTMKAVHFYGPRCEYIVSGSDCRNIFIWEKESEAIVQWMEGDSTGAINCLVNHPQLPVMATSGYDHDVKLWLPSPKTNKLDKGKLKDNIKANKNDRYSFSRYQIPPLNSSFEGTIATLQWRLALSVMRSSSDF